MIDKERKLAEVQEDIERVRRELRETRELAEHSAARFPKNALNSGLAVEGHIHGPLGGASFGIHYDAIVDENWPGPEGAALSFGGSVTLMFSELQPAIDAGDDANQNWSIRVNAGTYASVLIDDTFTHTLWIEGEAQDKVTIGIDANGITIANLAGALYLRNVTVSGGGGSYSLTAATASGEAHCEDVRFSIKVGGDFNDTTFRRCTFDDGYDIDSASFSPTGVYFSDCKFAGNGTNTWSAGSATRHYFDNCLFPSATQFVVTNTQLTDIVFSGCLSNGSANPFFHVNGSQEIVGLVFDGNRFAAPTSATTAPIYIQSCAANSSGCIVSDNTFEKNTDGTATILFVRNTSNLVGWAIVGNSFRKGGVSFDYAEDDGAVSVSGVFIDSVIGPNSPADFNFEALTSTNNTIYIGLGTVSGAGVTGVTTLPGGLTIEEDNASVGTNITTIDFTEPDGTLVTVSGSEADVAMSSYARLAGRSGGQTLIGSSTGTGAFTMRGRTGVTTETVTVRALADVGATDGVLDIFLNESAAITASANIFHIEAQTLNIGANDLTANILNATGEIANAGFTGTTFNGLLFAPSFGGGSFTEINGIHVASTGGSLDALTNFRGIHVEPSLTSTSGTTASGITVSDMGFGGFTTGHGLLIDAQTNATTTYAIRTRGTDDNVVLAGPVGIGADTVATAGIGLHLHAGHFRMAAGLELQMVEASGGTDRTIIKTGVQSADITYTLPTAAPSVNGQVLSGTTAGVLSWATAGGGDDALSMMGLVMGVG